MISSGHHRRLDANLNPPLTAYAECRLPWIEREKNMKNLFVGNMSFQTTESELRSMFEPFGQVTRVHIAMDRETGRARGFAFVEMPNDAEAAKAISGLDGKEVGGRNLKVNEARPKAASGGGGGG